jgi:hypothetical protein
MDSTPISSVFFDSESAGTTTAFDGPCVFKGAMFSSAYSFLGSSDTLVISDGSSELFTFYTSRYSLYAGGMSGSTIPGLGIRIDTSLKFTVGSHAYAITIWYQA